MQAELDLYLEIAKRDYPDTYKTSRKVYKDWRADRMASECAFIQMHDALPIWGVIIARFEIATNRKTGEKNYIFIHQDLEAWKNALN